MNLRYMLSKTIKKANFLPLISLFCVLGVSAQEMKPQRYSCTPFPNCFKKGFFIEGDFLYWKPEVNELEYALSINPVTSEAIEQHEIRYDWEPGFQVAIGYLFSNNWDLLARYTNLCANKTEMVSSRPNQDLFSSFTHRSPVNSNERVISSATSNTKLYYNVLDIEGIRHIFSANRLELLAFLGIRGAWVTQNWEANYSPVQYGIRFMQNKWKVQGGGFRFGIDANLELGRGFTFFGTGALTGLLADHETRFRTIAIDRVDPRTIFDSDIRFSRAKVFPVLEASMGIGWGTYFREGILNHRKDLWGLHIGARYEFIQWWSLNDIQRPDEISGFEDATPGNLGFHGLTLRATIVF